MQGGQERCVPGLVGKPEGKTLLEDPDLDGRIILKWIFNKCDVGHGLDRSGSE